MTDADDNLVSRLRCYPSGMLRTQEAGAPPTDKLFTVQRRETSIGMYYFGARFYEADLGRFIQADNFVPGPGT